MKNQNSRRQFIRNSMGLAVSSSLLGSEVVYLSSKAGIPALDIPVKIKSVDVSIERSVPSSNPIQDAIQTLPGIGKVYVKVISEEGISGIGDVYFGRIEGSLLALKSFIENILKPIVVGSDLGFIRGTYEAMIRETDYLGSTGFAKMGISAIDTALWDCLGKTLEVPCWKLWGACHMKLPAYAMVGWINLDENSIQEKCEEALNLGYNAVKLKIGFPTLAEDIKRIKFVKNVLGESVHLMIDANQAFTTGEAVERGKAFEDLGCYWYEEPLPAHDIEGYKQLSRELRIQIATGENLFSPQEFAHFIKHDAVDIIQPDLRRSGGPTALLEIGNMAHSFGIPYASHGSNAAHFNVMACLPNTIYVETSGGYKLNDGMKEIPQGWGFSWE